MLLKVVLIEFTEIALKVGFFGILASKVHFFKGVFLLEVWLALLMFMLRFFL